ncbi:MAG: Uma2 family endonuclease [Methylacidiphilales bacterium]|nr:Uma2 family endonuclease [Candidatus Methylacidiphilales bacterium]
MTMTKTMAKMPMTADAFLVWAEGREGRFEFAGGRIMMMVGASRNHANLAFRIGMMLAARLDPERWSVSSAELAVRIGESVRYPDVLVEPAGGDGAALFTDQPALIVEVLSPSSLALDFTTKTREYTSLASLKLYVVASADEPRLWLWRRGADGAFPLDPEEMAGTDAVLALPEFAAELPLAELYRNIR